MATPQDITALILAGGRGTRIAAIHPNLPKPMIPVAGVPFLEWLTRRLKSERFDQVIISVGHKAEVITDWAAKKNITCHIEEKPLGTGGAIADALPEVATSTVVIMNGDTLLLADIRPAIDRLWRDNLDGVIFARAVEDTSRYGSLDITNGLLHGFREKQPGNGFINGGIYVFHTEWLRRQLSPGVASMETDLLPRFLAQGARIGVTETNAPFIDIGTPESLASADAFVETHRKLFD